MNTATHYYMAGMGAPYRGLGATTTQTAVTALSTAASVDPEPISKAILQVAAAITGLIGQGCGQTCVETSSWANEAEVLLQQNLSAYFSQAPPRSAASQQQALQNFDAAWTQLLQLCSQSGLGTAGKNCIADRQAGSCKWKASPPQYPGEPAQGACWNWFNGYRDPIANDPNVAAPGIGGSILGGGSSNLLLIGAAVAGVVLLLNLS